ncbi:hypothetical protein ACLOJK_024946 [Asimina triloba]
MEKVIRQVATLLILATAATWVPTRLARELSSPSPVTVESPFFPDYYSYEPISDFTELEPISSDGQDDISPFAGDDIEPAAGPHDADADGEEENEGEETVALSECWVELGEECGYEVFDNFAHKKLALTRNCCFRVRKVMEKACWKTLFEEVGLLGASFGGRITNFCSGDLSRLPIEIGDPQH